jgi:hypothetical protein
VGAASGSASASLQEVGLEQGEPPEPGCYYCPYCRIQAPPDSFLTKEQVELVQNVILREVVGPEIEKFGRDVRRQRRPGDLLSIEVKVDLPGEMDPLVEMDDMKRVGFSCHPGEPVKVLDDWDREVGCLICGRVPMRPFS